ncbi:hypothetical protein [Solitalea lacus]|uniref:hypothetical protein n=1 Tax=Solitalea lacus TaxID=2911172 RepID=UPI001ED9F9B5|nr:hypothetical protein [Solitalea lacus]UKJ06475.1 hypothetical protein L2B55_13135 [Solitalea lacus]
MSGIKNFLRELQRFDIDISKNVITYNGYLSPKLYAVWLQKLYLQFNTELYAHLKGIPIDKERIKFLKELQLQLTEIDEFLLQTRDLLAQLQSLLSNKVAEYRTVLPRLKKMNIHIDVEGATVKQLEEIDLLVFIDGQISYSYEAISLAYSMITLELDIPSFYGIESKVQTYKLRWKGSMRHLTELFVELQRKGWIATIEDNQMDAAVQNIVSLFDIRRTRIPEDKEEYTSMAEILKGALKNTGERHYQLLYGKGYQPVFDEMKSNKSIGKSSGS